MKDVVYNTTVYNRKAGKYTLTAADSDLSYRKSRFTGTEDIVLSSLISLKKGDKENIKQKMSEFAVRRRESQPLDMPSAGSTFKRPKEGYAAALIEQAGLKGYTIGGAQVSEKHSGFIINRGNAKFTDIMAVIEHVQKTVLKQFGIELELEVKILR
jgi:UDP-N-acetylmuramate dehydrogenase